MQQPRIFFAVALHEKYALPTDALYTPIQAGAAIHPPLGLMRDDTGENISAKNGSYCELTVLYWMAHNVDADWYGLCHYRRYFSLRRTGCPQKRILTRAQLLPLLDTADIFLPKKRHYWLETNFTQYAPPHHQADLRKARAALARLRRGFGSLAFLGPPEEAGVLLAVNEVNEAKKGLTIDFTPGDSGDADNKAFETTVPKLQNAGVSAMIGAAASGVMSPLATTGMRTAARIAGICSQ